jgi:signal transduction histidine kinase/CheY-like chemotaxis protein
MPDLHWRYGMQGSGRDLLKGTALEASAGNDLARELGEARERARRQAAAARLGRAAVASEAAQPLLDAAVAIVSETLRLEPVAALELTPGSDGLVLRAGVGLSAAPLGAAIEGGAETRSALSLLSSGPVVALDLAADLGVKADFFHRERIACGAALLLGGGERAYGVLVACAREARTFESDELAFLEAAASVLGPALVRQQADAATAERERLFHAVFTRGRDAMAVSDPEGKILEANPAAEELFETPRASLVGGTLPILLSDSREGGVRWEEVLSAGKKDGEVELHLPGRLPKQLEFTAVGDVLPGRHLTVMRDVTDRRHLASRLALGDKMATVGRMAAGLAHELNDPLSYLSANLSYVENGLRTILHAVPAAASVRDGSGAPIANDLSRALSEAREGAEQMRVIIRDLSLFSRSDEDFRGAVEVLPILESCLDKAWDQIRHRGRLERAFAPVPPAAGNASMLAQVFLNLIVNAAQALGEGGPSHCIRVATSVARDGRIAVEVTDSGAGIPALDLPRIFDPFFTGGPAGVGTGLALSVCHNIVTSCGGDIEVESEPGRGSTFRVLLVPASVKTEVTPLPLMLSPPASLIPPRRPAAARGRILVVDDEPLVGVALKRALGNEHDLTVVSSAEEALARLRRGEPYDLLLSDLLMPGMTGMDLYQVIAREMPTSAPPILFLTGGAFTQDARAFLDEHAEDCVEKPFEVSALRELVRRRVGARRP